MQKDDFNLILPCPKRKDETCQCPREMRNEKSHLWNKHNRDVMKNANYCPYQPESYKPSLDTPGFLPLKYQQPM